MVTARAKARPKGSPKPGEPTPLVTTVATRATRATLATLAMRPRIVREATRLISARGFDGTTLQDIAEAVGVTKPAVLHHFPSKEHVQKAVLEEIVLHWEGTLPRLLLAATAGESRFESVIGAVYRFFAEDPSRTRVVLRHALDRPQEARALLGDKVRLWVSAVASYIRSGREKGLHPKDVDEDAYVLLILQLIIVAAASFDTMKEALPAGHTREAYDREIYRIARVALFPEGTPAPSKPSKKRPSPRSATRSASASANANETAKAPKVTPSKKPARSR